MSAFVKVQLANNEGHAYFDVSNIVAVRCQEDKVTIDTAAGIIYKVGESVLDVIYKIESALNSDITKSVSVETTSNGWINVEDRLPDDFNSVQIAYKILPNGFVYRNCIAYRKCGNWYLSYCGNCLITEKVVAWKLVNDADSTKDLWRCEE